jgi:hypothetical protein
MGIKEKVKGEHNHILQCYYFRGRRHRSSVYMVYMCVCVCVHCNIYCITPTWSVFFLKCKSQWQRRCRRRVRDGVAAGVEGFYFLFILILSGWPSICFLLNIFPDGFCAYKLLIKRLQRQIEKLYVRKHVGNAFGASRMFTELR